MLAKDLDARCQTDGEMGRKACMEQSVQPSKTKHDRLSIPMVELGIKRIEIVPHTESDQEGVRAI